MIVPAYDPKLHTCEEVFRLEILNLPDKDPAVKFKPDHSVEKLTWDEIFGKLDSEFDGKIKDGCYQPSDCQPQQETLVIVPYRDRDSALKILTYNLHKFMIQQHRSYCLLISEQSDKGAFNRGKLNNAGVLSGLNFYQNVKNSYPDCFIFHDVDHLPLNLKNLYGCLRSKAVHLSDKLDINNFESNLIGGSIFSSSGVTAVHRLHYTTVNGHPNFIFGHDEVSTDDFGNRLRRPELNVYMSDKFQQYNPLKNYILGTNIDPAVMESKTEQQLKKESKNSFGEISKENNNQLESYSFIRQESYGLYETLKSKSGSESSVAPGNLFELGPGPEDTLANLRLIRQDFDGFRATIFQTLKNTATVGFNKVTQLITPTDIKNLEVKAFLDLNEDGTSEADSYTLVKYQPNQKFCDYVKVKGASLSKNGKAGKFDPEHFQKVKNTCQIENENGPGCVMIDDNFETWSKPMPIFNRYGEDNFIVVRSCPAELGMLQIPTVTSDEDTVDSKLNAGRLIDEEIRKEHDKLAANRQSIIKPTTPIILKRVYEKSFVLKFNFTLEILQEPIGVVSYIDKVIYEDKIFDRELLGIWLPKIESASQQKMAKWTKTNTETNPNVGKNPRFYEHENSTVSINVERTDETHVRFEITRPLSKIQILPGIYMVKSKIVDFWGQPYLDLNFMFQVKSYEGERYEATTFETEFRKNYVEQHENKTLRNRMNFFYQARSSLYRHGLITKLTDIELDHSQYNHEDLGWIERNGE